MKEAEMAQQTSRVQEGVDQLRTRIRRIQRQVTTRRKALEKELTTRRKAIERRAQREIARVQKEIARQPLVKQAQKTAGSLRAGAQSRLEAGVAGVLNVFPLATKGEIDRIDRKLRSIDRKLREMEKGSGRHHAA
jgi:prophage DNA circulation protein